jgi:hypothetical protein
MSTAEEERRIAPDLLQKMTMLTCREHRWNNHVSEEDQDGVDAWDAESSDWTIKPLWCRH